MKIQLYRSLQRDEMNEFSERCDNWQFTLICFLIAYEIIDITGILLLFINIII